MFRVIFLEFSFLCFKDFSEAFANGFNNSGLSGSGRTLNKRNIGSVDSNIQRLNLFRIQGCFFKFEIAL